MHAFTFKLWWRFRENKSIWSHYMFNRYCKGIHPAIVPVSNNSTNVWKRVWHIRNDVEPYIHHWIIGRGDIDICLNKRLDINLPMLSERVPVKTLFINGKDVNTENATRLLGNLSCDLIKQEKISLSLYRDKLCWSKSSSGNFIIKSAWEVIRKGDLQIFTYKHFGTHTNHLKFVFLWKLLHNAIPTDLLVQKKEIPLASKCSCCSHDPKNGIACAFVFTRRGGPSSLGLLFF